MRQQIDSQNIYKWWGSTARPRKPTFDETRLCRRLIFVLSPQRHDLQRCGTIVQHLVYKVFHRFLNVQDSLSAAAARVTGWVCGRTHGFEPALFGFRYAFSGGDIADWLERRV